MIGEAMPKRKPRHADRHQGALSDGEGQNDRGPSRWHLIRECEASFRAPCTEVIDLYQLHQWDGLTPLEETMERSNASVLFRKRRYVGCSNFSAAGT